MGGHAAGDMASRLVVVVVRAAGPPRARGRPACAPSPRRPGTATPRSPKVVHENPELDGMGTTVTALLFDGGRLAHGARRRLPGVPVPRRHAAPAHPRRHLRAVADRRRADHPGGGRAPPAAVPAAARPERHRRRPVAHHPRGQCRRPLPDLLRRPARRGVRRGHRRGPGEPGRRRGGRRARCSSPWSAAARTTSPCIVADVVDTGVGTGPTQADADADPDATGPIGIGRTPSG